MAANMGTVIFPGQFDPKSDKWSEYKDRLLCALDVAGISENDLDRARSLFLSQCGKETYSLIVSLLVPLRPVNVPFKDILAVLDKFYEPEVNEILQAGKFHKRVQSKDESVQDFVAAISLLGVQCNFSDLTRQLRDRLVLGVRDDRLRRELLKVKHLTYESAVQQCLNYQATFHDMYPDAVVDSKLTPSTSSEPMEIGKIKSDDCRHCARRHKVNEQCPFVKARCFYCKKYGHITSACSKKNAKVHQVESDAKEATVEGPSAYLVRTEDGELHRRHIDQLVSRAVAPPPLPSVARQTRRSSSISSSPSEPPIVIPPPEQWPDIIGIPDAD